MIRAPSISFLICRCGLRYDRYAAPGGGFATNDPPSSTGLPVTIPVRIQTASCMIHNPSHGLSTGIDVLPVCLAVRRGRSQCAVVPLDASSRKVSPLGSQVMPALAPPKGTLTSAVFQVIREAANALRQSLLLDDSEAAFHGTAGSAVLNAILENFELPFSKRRNSTWISLKGVLSSRRVSVSRPIRSATLSNRRFVLS